MTGSKLRYTIFVFLRTTEAWLATPRLQRDALASTILAEALKDGSVAVRHFDAEAFTGRCSDVAMFEADDLGAFYFVMERLRDSVFFTKPYFEVVDIIPAVEDGFRQFQRVAT